MQLLLLFLMMMFTVTLPYQLILKHNKNVRMVPLGVFRDNKSLSRVIWIKYMKIEKRKYLSTWQYLSINRMVQVQSFSSFFNFSTTLYSVNPTVLDLCKAFWYTGFALPVDFIIIVWFTDQSIS